MGLLKIDPFGENKKPVEQQKVNIGSRSDMFSRTEERVSTDSDMITLDDLVSRYEDFERANNKQQAWASV